VCFFFSSRRRHTRFSRDWSSDVCSSDLWFPFWAAPEQVRILTINDTVMDYVDEIRTVLTDTILMKPVKYNEVRFTTDERNESLRSEERRVGKECRSRR